MDSDRPPLGLDPRSRALLERMCERAGVPFTEWECARLLTEFKRKLSESQWASLREDPAIRSPADALRALIVFGFENRRLERLHLRARGRERVWAQPEQQRRMAVLLGRGSEPQAGDGKAKPAKPAKPLEGRKQPSEEQRPRPRAGTSRPSRTGSRRS